MKIKMKIKLMLGFFFLGCILNTNILQALDREGIVSPPPQGYVKVRIWNSDFSSGIVDHVSVQTPSDLI